jgi:transposase-like protein
VIQEFDDISSHEYKMLTDKQTKQEAIEMTKQKKKYGCPRCSPTVPGV